MIRVGKDADIAALEEYLKAEPSGKAIAGVLDELGAEGPFGAG